MRHLITTALLASCASAAAFAEQGPGPVAAAVTARLNAHRAFKNVQFTTMPERSPLVQPLRQASKSPPPPPTFEYGATPFTKRGHCGMPVLAPLANLDPRMVKKLDPRTKTQATMRIIAPPPCGSQGTPELSTRPAPTPPAPKMEIVPAMPPPQAAPAVPPAPAMPPAPPEHP